MAIAATTQIGDQGLTIGRTAALLAGLPKSVPGYAIDRMCAGAMTAVTTSAPGRSPSAPTTSPSPAASSTWAATRWARASTPTRGSSPRSWSTRRRWSWASTAENLHDRFPHLTKERADAYAVRSQEKPAKAYANGKIQPDLVPVATRTRRAGLGPGHRRRAAAPGHHAGGPGRAEDAVPPARPGHRRQRGRPQRRRHRAACSPPRRPPRELGLPVRMRLVAFAFAGVEPEVMGVGPIPATEKALRQAGLTIDDIGLFEINEAFAVQVLAFLDHFGIADDDPRVNQYGGAIAVGHPLASSGVRLMTQLARAVRGAPRGPLRPDHHVHRPRHGRHRDLGEPALRLGSRADHLQDLLDEQPQLVPGRGRHRRRTVRDVALPGRRRHARADHPRQRPRPHQAEHLRPGRRWPR